MGRVEEASWADRTLPVMAELTPGVKHELAPSQVTEEVSQDCQSSPFYKPHSLLHTSKSIVEKSIRKLKIFNLIVRSTCTKKIKRIINCEMIRNEQKGEFHVKPCAVQLPQHLWMRV